MNKSNSNNSSKRFKSPVLQHSITIVRPDRPLISRKREDSESEFEEDLPPVVETEDLLSSVLGKTAKVKTILMKIEIRHIMS